MISTSSKVAFFLAAGANIAVSILSILIAVRLHSEADGTELASLVLRLVILQFILAWGLIIMTNWVAISEEVRLRKALLKRGEKKRSVANVDVLLGIDALRFFVYFPGVLFSSLIYLFFTYTVSPQLFLIFIGFILVLAYPLFRYFRWRSRRIGRIRRLRALLVDKDQSLSEKYARYLDTYAFRLFRFWKWDVMLGALFRVFILLYFVLSYYINADHPQLLGLIVVQVVLLSQMRTLFLNSSVFQEDFKSLKAVTQRLG